VRNSESIAYAEGVAREQIEAARQMLSDLLPTPARDSLMAMAELVLTRRA
jgi:geranylgeranyl pyrophosphate synthase